MHRICVDLPNSEYFIHELSQRNWSSCSGHGRTNIFTTDTCLLLVSSGLCIRHIIHNVRSGLCNHHIIHNVRSGLCNHHIIHNVRSGLCNHHIIHNV